ncbi:hypothetical protein AB1399_00890 [Hydrogenibacillus schlegelii]|uniref:TadE/TadG family type IV pilus assembly protein n=1 Tax=Hydrogenibacillus schlegelii TaxID=1484 RepID=UPI0008331802|nr:hypothetical protein [Hydrogenibacillus schlegelii]
MRLLKRLKAAPQRFQGLKDDRGVETIEFLMMLPFYVILFFIFLQVITLGLQFFVSQHAVNEAAKVYAVTGDLNQAREMAARIVGTGYPDEDEHRRSLMRMESLNISGDDSFTVTMRVRYWLGLMRFLIHDNDRLTYTVDHRAEGKALLP